MRSIVDLKVKSSEELKGLEDLSVMYTHCIWAILSLMEINKIRKKTLSDYAAMQEHIINLISKTVI